MMTVYIPDLVVESGLEHFVGKPCYDMYKSAYEITKNCLNNIYSMVQPSFPDVELPDLRIVKGGKVNAYTADGYIFLCSDLIDAVVRSIEHRYSDARLNRLELSILLTNQQIRTLIRVYSWRFIALHELYHIWRGHLTWECMYEYDRNGVIVCKEEATKAKHLKAKQELRLTFDEKTISEKEKQRLITSQALELDADASAESMLVNLLMREIEEETLRGYEIDKIERIKENAVTIMAACSNAFCVFDGEKGAQFEKLRDKELIYTDHPIPAIRSFYAEEIISSMLFRYVSNETIQEIEDLWLRLCFDNEDGECNQCWHYTFDSPAYTLPAQQHLNFLKRRLTEMYDTLKQYSTGNYPDKLQAEVLIYNEN